MSAHPASLSLLPLLLCCRLLAVEPGPDLVVNGGVEDGANGWQALWTREADAGSATIERREPAAGATCWLVVHRGTRDWSLGQEARWPVVPGTILELSAAVRVTGSGHASLGMISRAADGAVGDWNLGGRTVTAGSGWQRIATRVVVPPGIATVQLRLISDGPAEVGLDEVHARQVGSIDALRTPGLPPTVTVADARLSATLDTRDARLAVTDRRNGRTWLPAAVPSGLVVLAAQVVEAGAAGPHLDLRLLDPASLHEFTATIAPDTTAAELLVTVRAAAPTDGLDAPLRWPPAFASQPGQLLIMPLNEGISYPVDDETLPGMRYYLYGGHGLCMPWYGAAEGDGRGAAWMAIVETADDAALALPRQDGLLQAIPEWEGQRGMFGDERRLRYVFLERGGHVAMAKRYRAYAQATGLLRTLADKRVEVPAVDQLVGAVNVWCWERDAATLCRELQAAGIARILWSNGLPAEQLTALNAMDVLTSRYDIYQDTMDPASFPRLKWQHPDWTTGAWAAGDIQRGRDGRTLDGWEIEAKDGGMIPCGVLCDRQALPYIRQRLDAELKTKPYRCRFIDTTTASPWRECWDPAHPMTRSDSKRFRVELLKVVSTEHHLVCGSETGHDAAVPVVHYFEGMLSLGPYRVPDSGRRMAERWNDVPSAVATFQTGHRYRLPLWELVYHDCVVAHWYWGDYNDKLPALWDRRDLWNALYGTMPLFMFDAQQWHAQRERYVRSYRATAPIARATGYAEMLDHAWLTADHAVQRCTFAGGVTVTANFGDRPWTDGDGVVVAPLATRITGLPSPVLTSP